MAIDIRATVTCSLGTLISGSISDDYLQGSGLVKTRGSCEISGIITPAMGTVVTFSYTKGGVTRSIPRKLRVLSSFADPFRRTTKVELGCKLTYLSDLKESLSWDAFNDPENRDTPRADAEIVTLPIYASSIMGQCLAKLGLAASGSVLTNAFSIESFDFSPGYVQVLSDLLVSECYFGYLDANEVLQIRSLNEDGGTGPVFTSEDIVDVGSIGVGQLPGEAVTVSYSTLVLKVPEEEPEEDGEGGGEGGDEGEDTPGGIPSSTTPPAGPEEAEAQAIINEKRNWERQETYGSPEEYYIPYTRARDGAKFVAVFTGTASTISETKYKTIRFSKPPKATFPVDNDDLTLIGSTLDLPIYALTGNTAELPTYTGIGNTASLTEEQQDDFESNPTSVLEEVWPSANLYDAVSDGTDDWVYLSNGWTLNPPTYQEQFEENPTAVLDEIWPDPELYDYIGDGSDKWVYLSDGWVLNPPTYLEQFEENPTAVLNEIWPSPSVYDYVSDDRYGAVEGDKWIHTGSGNWYHDKKARDPEELYEKKEVPVLRTTEEYGPSIAIASSVANDRLTYEWGFNNDSVLISKIEQTFNYDEYGNQTKTEILKYENKLKVTAASDLRWADAVNAINLSTSELDGMTLTEQIVTTNELQSGYTRETTSTYLKHIFTQNGQQALANAVEQAVDINEMVDVLLWIIDSGLVHDQTSTTVSRTGSITSQERPPAPVRANSVYAKGTPSEEQKQINQENTSTISDTATTEQNNEETPDPNNGYRIESSSELALALGSAAAERRIELSMPYAPDDRFVKSANTKYYSIKSNAKSKAAAFGRIQNRLLLGNRSGINLQLAPERLPAAPFDPLYVQANGLTALYRANGTTWAFDSSGIVASVDALFWGAVGGTGTFWFPVAPGITTLPTTPPVVGGEMNATTVVLPYNETAIYIARLKLGTTVIRYGYSLGLLTEVEPLTVTIAASTSLVRVINVPSLGTSLAALMPQVSISARVDVPTAAVALAGALPEINTGKALAVSAAATISLAALVPELIGRPRTSVFAPSTSIALAAAAPAVATGVSVAVPVATVTLAGLRPATTGKLDIEAFDLFLLVEDDLLSLRNP